MRILVLVTLFIASCSGRVGADNNADHWDSLVAAIIGEKVDDFNKQLEANFGNDANARNPKNKWTPLHYACFYGKVEIAKSLFERNFLEMNPLNDDGDTPLHLASLHGHLSVVNELLPKTKNRGRDLKLSDVVDAENPNSLQTPLFYAAKSESNISSDIAIALMSPLNGHLVDGQANIKKVDKYGMMPIHVALINRNFEVLTAIGQWDATIKDLPCCGKAGLTLSHLAAQRGVHEFLDSTKGGSFFDPLIVDHEGQTPACWAAANGSVKFAESMLSYHSLVSIVNGKCKYPILGGKEVVTGNPLHIAAYNHHQKYLQFLLTKYSDMVRLGDSRDGSALHALAEPRGGAVSRTADETAILNELVHKFNASVDSLDNKGASPFLIAVSSGRLILADALRINGGSVDRRDKSGYSALHLANDQNTFQALLNMNIQDLTDVNLVTKSEKKLTPLHVAVLESKDVDSFVKYLVEEKSASLTSEDDLGRTVIHMAVEVRNKKAVTYFLGNMKIDFSRPNKAGFTPLVTAVEKGYDEIALMMIAHERYSPSAMTSEVVPKTGDSILHLAAKANRIELIKAFAKKTGSDLTHHIVATVNAAKETALHVAVLYDSLQVADFLLKSIKQADENKLKDLLQTKDVRGRTPVHLAALECNEETLKLVLPAASQVQALNDIKEDVFDETPMDIAVKRNCFSAVRMLLDYLPVPDGCLKLTRTINAQKENSGKPAKTLSKTNPLFINRSPLIAAEMMGHRRLADEMLATGKCNDGSPLALPLNAAFEMIRENFEGRRYEQCNAAPAFEKRLDLSGVCSDTTLLEHQQNLGGAAASGEIEEVKRLMQLGFLDANWQDKREVEESCPDACPHPPCSSWWRIVNATALHRAVRCSASLPLLEHLVNDLAADVNAVVGEAKYSPLHLAVYNGNFGAAQLLLEKGANVNAETEPSKCTPLALIRADRYPTVEALLRQNGAIKPGKKLAARCTKQ